MPQRSLRLLLASITAIVLLCVLTLQGMWKTPPPRYVIIHSDDAGMCHSVNVATIDSMQRGIVSSTSIMTCCDGFPEFAQFAKKNPELDFGVHLTLTNERSSGQKWGPVTPATKVPSLVDPQGRFWRASEDVAAHAKAAEVDKELRAQIQRALDAGINISHLDNHMMSLLTRPDLIALYVQLGLDYDLPIRYRKAEKLPASQRQEFVGNTLIAYADEEKRLQEHNMPIFDFVESNNYDVVPDKKRNYFLRVLRDLKPGVSEILVHCAYRLPGHANAPAVDQRAMDAKFFQSPEAAETVRRLGLKVITWKQFRELKEQGAI